MKKKSNKLINILITNRFVHVIYTSFISILFVLLFSTQSLIAQRNMQFALARYDAKNGSLDPAFDTDGKVLTDFYSSIAEEANSITRYKNDKIVVAGYTFINGGKQFAIARYNNDGSLDVTFDGDGKVITDFISSSNEEATSIAVYKNDKIILAGYAVVNGSKQFALACYNSDGSLDNSFDRDGKVLTDYINSSEEVINSLVIDKYDKIVVAGYAVVNGSKQMALARYNSNGNLELSFGGNGMVLTDFKSSSNEVANSICSIGKYIAIAGYAAVDDNKQFALALYNLKDGSLCNKFDTDGKVLTDFYSSSDEEAMSLEFLHFFLDSKIVVAGYAVVNNSRQFALACYKMDGSLNLDFDDDGKVLTDFKSSWEEEAHAISGHLLSGIWVAGYAIVEGNRQFALAKYNLDGSLNVNFDHDGKVLTDFKSSLQEGAFDIELLDDDKIVAVGSAYLSSSAIENETTKEPIPKAYRLEQNYPNPFNPETMIRFNLPEPSFVSLKIYNIAGQEIKTLIRGIKSDGTYQIDWKPNNLQNGVYFYRLQAGEFTKTKKMILQK